MKLGGRDVMLYTVGGGAGHWSADRLLQLLATPGLGNWLRDHAYQSTWLRNETQRESRDENHFCRTDPSQRR
jgi:hypothetical protein